MALPKSFIKSSIAPRVGEQDAVAEISEEGISEKSDEDRSKSQAVKRVDAIQVDDIDVKIGAMPSG